MISTKRNEPMFVLVCKLECMDVSETLHNKVYPYMEYQAYGI